MLVSRDLDEHVVDALRLSDTFSLPQIALGYGALALVTGGFTVVGARDRREAMSEETR